MPMKSFPTEKKRFQTLSTPNDRLSLDIISEASSIEGVTVANGRWSQSVNGNGWLSCSLELR